jgi:hypothetical protein
LLIKTKFTGSPPLISMWETKYKFPDLAFLKLAEERQWNKKLS